ncbi:MFS transporter [Kribbella turkmenica]|uniref:MFS transporter n=1 Tax=Kribbella turkmenica TaxID=2530375 RepID=A0A4R4XDX7_9ACTN|nr:MFS transporter [Kribbella turkmenica]TDD28642.1 MFS transporter [Kribbella turkmenica]
MQSPDPSDRKASPGSAGAPPAGATPGAKSGGQPADGSTGKPAGKRADERISGAKEKLGTASRKVGQASRVGVSGFASASRKTALVGGKVGRATGRRISGLTGAQGARESGLSRLIELGAVNAAGDTAFAVSLAGTVFFAVPSEQARDRVALFLLLTMAPFALMAPLIGPILDRFRHGRRWAIGATLGLRGFLVWSLAASMTGSTSPWLYPAALGCLVASKAYGVTRASAVPRLLPKEITLVTANSRISLAGVAGATIGAGIAGAFAAIGPEWSLRWAALVYTVGLVLAIRLPSRVDSPAGEEITGTAGREARRRAITAAVARGIRCNLGLRFVSGFLTMYLAFLLRDKPLSGIDGALAAGAVIAAAGLGNSLGTLIGSLLKARKPEAVVLVVLLADATVAILVAVFYGFPILIALGLVAGLCSSLGKLSLDAMIQRDVPETVRTSVFARSETVLQLSWVIGGGCGIVLPLIPRLGFGFLAGVLLVVVFLVVRMKPSSIAGVGGVRPTGTGGSGSVGSGLAKAGPGASGTSGPGAGSADRRPETRAGDVESEPPTSTSRTILTTSVAEQRANRENSQRQHDEPTVEWASDDHRPPRPASSQQPRSEQAVGRWWSGQPDEDDEDTVEDHAPWAEDPTVERDRGGVFNPRRRGGHPPQ